MNEDQAPAHDAGQPLHHKHVGTPAGRRIWVIWRYDREDDEIPDVFGELGNVPIFVITAY